MVRRRIVLLFMACTLLAAGLAAQEVARLGQQQHEPTAGQRNLLETFLREYVKDPHYDYKATRYAAAFVDLRDDGTKQAIVYFIDRYSCASGGCTTLILDPRGASYRVVTSITIARLPIRVLSTKSNGWHDVSVVVASGGIQPGYEAMLPFDGKTYPKNPTVLPARRLSEKVSGEIVIASNAQDKLLFP